MKNTLLLTLILLGQFYMKAQEKPNILWIMTDDHRADAVESFNKATIGSKESKLGYVSSPNIDQLAKEGTLFVNAYCNSPACAPSRASMMTGLYPHHDGITGFELGHNQTSITKKLIPEVLKEYGYGTSIYGKFGYRILSWDEKKQKASFKSPGYYDHELNGKNDLQILGFTDYSKWDKIKEKGKPDVGTEDFIFSDGTKLRVIPEAKSKKDVNELARVDKKLSILRAYTRQQSKMIIGGESPKPAFETFDGFILKEFDNYLNSPNKGFKTYSGRTVIGPKTSEPQFMSLNFHLPHTPVLPPKEFRDQFKNKKYKIPAFDKNTELSKLPLQLKKLYKTMKIDGLSEAEKQQAVQDYYAFCAYADALIGKAIKDFKKYSKENNQEYVIILTIGDHGWQLGEQGIEAKFAPYDVSNRGAIVVASSIKNKFPVNKVSKEYVEYVDIYTTILSAANIDINASRFKYLDGFDMEDIAKGTGIKREYVLGEMNHVYGPRAYIRNKEFAFSMRIKEKNSKPGKQVPPGTGLDWARNESLENVEVALFDLRNDADERNNVALKKEYRKLSEWFRKKLTDIVLGDGRVEIDWSKKDDYKISNFAVGSDDKKLDIPKNIIPAVN
ncbi:sulfatase-like hydrolase/transferase [Polaribacter sp. Z014]|uniref:sulfatase-like hydrolase/transferase n=1 Tax=Polaribacter sp. Z014 TaxID=2927126 RepID=UPI0020204E1E|nr:sulfatase-like hydrolase/transferase [Polaribacter sp. Z014]MCL7762590.1 sulfatase-like hydrolase/transferase [Polaribacter sp. Z014]